MTYPLTLQLAQLPPGNVRGIYTVRGVPDQMPERALFLHPDVARSFLDDLADWVTVSDIFRSPESSLAAVRAGRGAQAPGYSGHNYGLSIDLDVRASWQYFSARPGTGLNKSKLDGWLEERGWYCHRRDHRMASEAWHYNFLGVGVSIPARFRSTSGYIEERIKDLYGSYFDLTPAEAQRALAKLRLYHGAIDGLIGPLSREATRVFQRAWGLRPTGTLTDQTERTLAYVACERRMVTMAGRARGEELS